MANDPALLKNRLRTLSRDLCSALGDAIESALTANDRATTGALRPVQLTGVLGLDKSLASRVVKSLSVDDELLALHGIPTPQGLHLIASAARQHGATPETVARLEHVAGEYRALLDEFGGGRTDLEATLAGWIPEQRARAERDARRSVFRGMTTMTGTRAGTIYHALYLVPSQQEGKADSLIIGVRQDLRRLRTGERLLIASLRSAKGTGGWGARRTTLQGQPLAADARAIVLRDLCSHPIPKLDLETEDEQLVISIGSDTLDVNESTTLGFGWRTEAHFELHATGENDYHHVSVESIRPSEALVFDLFVHEEIELCAPPFVTLTTERHARLSPPRAPTSAQDRSSSAQDGSPRRDLEEGNLALVSLDRAPGGLASVDVRACPAIAETVCREAGFMLDQFRKFRARIEFPLPTEQLTLWWRRENHPR